MSASPPPDDPRVSPTSAPEGAGGGGRQEIDSGLAITDGRVFAGGSPEMPGQMIGPYRLLSAIGEGGFGIVWLAERREPMVQRVAIKIIKPGMDSREVIARFEQERQALAVMDHPNVARVLDAGSTPPSMGSRPYFVMEYVKGEPITAFCDRHRLTMRQRLELFLPVCEAIQHAHLNGIIHRDIKPSNVLVSTVDAGSEHARGDAERTGSGAGLVAGALVKVIDFGIAKAIAGGMSDKTIFTEQGRMMGTLEYMSPEQACGGLNIDPRTDVYSLGVLLYELLAGVLPFDSRDLRNRGYAEATRIVREVDPPTPSERVRQLDAQTATRLQHTREESSEERANILARELEWIPVRAMSKEPARRYATVGALAADVRNYLDGRPLTARRPSLDYRARKWTLRTLGARGALAAAVVLATLTGWAATHLVLPSFGQTCVQWMTQEAQARTDRLDIDGKDFQFLRVVRLTDRTDPIALAKAEKIALPEDADRLVALRALHSRLLDRLAIAGARGVAFDIQFKTRNEFDGFLRQRAEPGRQMAVYFAGHGWGGGVWESQAEAASTARVGGVTFGADPDTHDIDAELALLRPRDGGGSTIGLPSLSVGLFAAYIDPAPVPRLSVSGERLAIDLGPARRSPVLIWSHGIVEEAEAAASVGTQAGDLIVHLPVLVPSNESIERACTEYADVFSANPEQLRQWFAGRVVLLADAADRKDYHPYSDGRTVGGYVFHAQTAEALIRAFAWREAWWADCGLAATAALGGLGISRVRRLPVVIAVASVAALGVFCASGVLLHMILVLVNPSGPVCGMLLAFAMIRWLAPAGHGAR